MDEHTPPSSASHVRGAEVENAFPTPPRGLTPDPCFRINGRSSPAPAKLLNMQRTQSTPPELTNDAAFRHVSNDLPGDLPNASTLEQSWSKMHLSKKRSQYYSDAFAYREPLNSARERVIRDSFIIVEMRLNCCLDSEQEFLIDLSFRVSEIYHRPESSVMVSVITDTSMMIGGSSEPAYLMTITGLPPEIAATKNKRSAHLLQLFILESLKIGPRRGVLRFEPVSEANLATNGITALQEIESLGRQSQEGLAFRTLSRTKSRSKRASGSATANGTRTIDPNLGSATPSVMLSSMAGASATKTMDLTETKKRKMRLRKSIFDIFRRRDMESLNE